MKRQIYPLIIMAISLMSIDCTKMQENNSSKSLGSVSNAFTSVTLKKQFNGVVIRDYKYIVNDDDINPIYTNAMMKVANCIVVKADWKDLQPTSAGTLITNVNSSDPLVTIDAALNYINNKQAQTGVPMYLKIRVYGGLDAPDWAKQTVGTINFTDQDDDGNPITGTLAKFWSNSGNNGYLDAFADLMNQLALKYDSDDRVLDITASACGITTVEPCLLKCGLGVIGASNPSYANCKSLIDGGYTPNAHFLSIKKSILKMNNAVSKTRLSLCFSPYQILKVSDIPNKYEVWESLDSAKMLINYFASTLGKKGIMGNNGLRDTLTSTSPKINDWKAPNGIIYLLYTYMKNKCNPGGTYDNNLSQRPSGIYFQTANPGDVGDLLNTLSQAIDYQAGAVELPSLKNIESRPTPNQLKPKDQALEAQSLAEIP
jgi:hypothetical protein